MNIKKITLIICGFLLFGIAKAQTTRDTTAVECGSFTWYGTEYTETGDLTYTFKAADGSDSSIVTLHLTVNPTYDLKETVKIFESELPYPWQDTTFEVGTVSDVFVFNRQTINGCDSIVTLNLTVLPDVVFISVDTTVCFDDPFITRNDTVRNQLGYDVMITEYKVTRLPEITHEFSKTACPPYTWNNETYSSSGDYVQKFAAANGCDSTVTLHLTANPAPDETQIKRKGTSDILICADADTAAHYQWGFIDLKTRDTSYMEGDYVDYQYFKMPPIDTRSYKYFVDIRYGNGCTTRSYYDESKTHSDTANSQKITVAPNPAKAYFTVSLSNDIESEFSISMLNLCGQIVHKKQFAEYEKGENINFNVELPVGLYFVVVRSKSEISTSKVMIR